MAALKSLGDDIDLLPQAWRGARLKPYWRSAPLASADRFAWLDGEVGPPLLSPCLSENA